MEVRSSDGKLVFTGYASKFNLDYPVGSFVERVSPGAFRRSLNDENLKVVFLINHGEGGGLPLASTRSVEGREPTLRLREDATGLHTTAILANDDAQAKQLATVQRHSGLEMSFSFKCETDEFSERNGIQHRDIKSALINGGDVSAVTYGASESTADDIVISERAGIPLAERREMLKGLWERRMCPVVDLAELRRNYSDSEREKLAAEGKALQDGSFPIVDRTDLLNAIKAYGRAKDKNEAMLWIKKRATALGLTDLLPETWRSARAAEGETWACPTCGSALVVVCPNCDDDDDDDNDTEPDGTAIVPNSSTATERARERHGELLREVAQQDERSSHYAEVIAVERKRHAHTEETRRSDEYHASGWRGVFL